MGCERDGCQPNDEGRQVSHLRERRPERQIADQRNQSRLLASQPPRPRDVPRKRARNSENEVAHPDIAGIHQPPRRSTRLDQHTQICLTHIGRNNVGRDTDEKPTPPTQPPFGRRDHPGEDRDVRPPSVVVEPEQARRQNPQRLRT